MRRLASVVVLLALGAACVPCGSYEVSGTTATTYDGDRYDGRWTERCGPLTGATGQWNDFGDGRAWITFDPDAPGDRGWQAIDFEIELSFATGLLVPGAVLGLDELAGRALINPGITLEEDVAGLTEGTLEVLSGWEGDDVCAVEDGPEFRLRWDLRYGGEGGPTYALQGTDRVQFSTWISEDCGG